MNKNNLSLSIIFFASISISLFSFSATFAEVDTDKSVYSKGELVEIFGSLDLQDDQRVNIIEIEIIDFNDDTVVNEYTPINDDNKFSRSYETSAWITGHYKLAISYNGVEESTEFEIFDSSSSDNNDDNSDDINNESYTDQQESSTTSSNIIPNSPVNLKADVVSSTQIDLSWSVSDDNDTSIIGYKIEVRTNTNPNYSTAVENTGSIDTIYSHTGLTPDTVYTHRVSAISSADESGPSSSTTVKTFSSSINASSTDIEDTDIPTDVVATAISPTSIELSWNPPTQTYGQSIQGYTIKQELASGVYNEVANSDSSSTHHTISNLHTDKIYTFVVIVNYLRGSSDVSEKATATLTSSSDNSVDDNSSSVIPDDVPDLPVELKVKPVSSTQIDLSWSISKDNSNNNVSITGYKIEVRTISNSSYSIVIDNTKNTDTTYSHIELIPNTTYIYRVSAINNMGTSESSSENLVNTLISDLKDDENNNTLQENESDSTQDDNNIGDSNVSSLSITAPSSPIDLQATQISQSRINLSWSAPIDNGVSQLLEYKIESKTSNESDYSVLIANTGSAYITTYSHTGLTAGLTYHYRIYAINSSGESSPSDMVEATIVLTNGEQTYAQQQSSLTLQPLQITLNTDKSVYGPDDSIEISGTTNYSTQNMPLGIRVISSDNAIVYVRSVSFSDDKTFTTVISPLQRQSSYWQDDGKFTVEVTYNGRVQATTTFENENIDTVIENKSSFSNQPKTESNEPQQSLPSSSTNESITSNDELEILKNQNTVLQFANQQLQNENNQFKTQIEELNKKIEQLDTVIIEQIRVMMETIGISKSDN